MTVTVKAHVAVLPFASVAVLVTVVVPTGKANPLEGTLVTVAPGQLSVTVTVKVTLLLHAPGAALTLRLAGQVTAGGVLSTTVKEVVQVFWFPAASTAVTVMVCAPKPTDAPAAGFWLKVICATDEQLSLTVTPLKTFGTEA